MIKIVIAKSFKQKLIGLMNQKNINYGMYFPNVSSIHTFFMKESIDVIGLNKQNIITEIHQNVRPNKFLIMHKAYNTLELPNNYSKNFKVGQKFNIKF